MKDKAVKIFFWVLSLAVLVTAAVMFSLLFKYDKASQAKRELYHIEIAGEYSEEGGPWKPLTREVFFQNLTYRDIKVRGHFTRDLPENSKLFLNIDHVRASLKVNGEEVFYIGPVEGDGNLTQAVGRQWVTVTSPGISSTDTVELSFGNLYKNAYMIQFDELLWQMHTGDEQLLLLEAISLDAWPLGIGTAFLFLALFLFAIALGCIIIKIKAVRHFLWLGLTSLSTAFWFYTLSSAPTLILPLPVLLNVIFAFSMQGMVIFFILFGAEHVTGWRKSTLHWCTAGLVLVMQVALINQLLKVQDLYNAIDYFAVFDLGVIVWFIYCIGYEAKKQKSREAFDLLKAMIPLAVLSALELVNGLVQFSKAAVLVGIGLIVFVAAEGISTMRRIKKSVDGEKRALALENELQQNQILIMLSQIQPHFLYNSLQTIKLLCDIDPPKASEALEHFSFYLRGNLDSLSADILVPFEKELEHIKDYLYLEKMRFSKKLNIKWELLYTDFLLPPLTVQPLIENAIRHGITKKKGGGTLTVKCELIGSNAVISICDDGAGFDENKQANDGRTHIGIKNTRDRLHSLCSGSLIIESKAGVGTTAKIILPQGEAVK